MCLGFLFACFKTVGTVLMRASFPVEWSTDVGVSVSELAFRFCFFNCRCCSQIFAQAFCRAGINHRAYLPRRKRMTLDEVIFLKVVW